MTDIDDTYDIGLALTAIDPAHTDRREVGMLLGVDETFNQPELARQVVELVEQVLKAAQTFVAFDVAPGDIRVEGG